MFNSPPILTVAGINLFATLLVILIPSFNNESNQSKLFSLYEISVGGLYGVYQLNKSSSSINISQDAKGEDEDEI